MTQEPFADRGSQHVTGFVVGLQAVPDCSRDVAIVQRTPCPLPFSSFGEGEGLAHM